MRVLLTELISFPDLGWLVGCYSFCFFFSMATGLRFEGRLEGVGNFNPWKQRISLLFKEVELWDIVESPVTVPDKTADAVAYADYQKRNIKAQRILMDAIKDHVMPHVFGKDNAYEMWAALVKLYQSSNQNRKMMLREKLRGVKMTKGESVTSYLTRLSQVRNELGAVGDAVESEELVKLALNGFSKSWDSFVRGIVARENMPTWERLWDDFVQEELRVGGSSSQQQGGGEEENVALLAKGGKKKKQTKKGPKAGAKAGSEEKKDLSKVRCWACNKNGHYAVTCPQRKKNKGKSQTAATAEVDDFASHFENEFSLVVCLSTSTVPDAVWYIDSGASRHMTGVRDCFTEFSSSAVEMSVILGDDSVVRAVGTGTVGFERESQAPLLITDVLHVPGLKKNLISVSSIEDKGFDVLFTDGQVLMYPKGSSVTSAKVIGVREGRLYRFLFQPCRALSHTVATSDSDLCELWHRRMAHLHHGALRVLREIVTGLPEFREREHDEVCHGCTLGKYTKAAYPRSDSRATGVLELIHSDVCGPMSSVSLSGFEYFVIFIDDYSRKTWIYFMKTKSQVFSLFQEFKALVENQTGKKIKALRSDNGGEYVSNDFKDFCAQEGIRREWTVPYNPQQNEVAERKNRSIVGAARSMLHDQSLPFFLWAEACSTAVYLQNRSPHRVLGSKTPEEAFTGKKPDVSRFRIFGCMTYSHVPEEKRTKLEPTAEKGIFVGYSETSKAYRIYISALRKTVLRRDVRFEEEKAVVKSRGLDQVQSGSQVQGDLIQGTGGGSGSQVSGVTGSQVTGSQVTGP